MPPSPHADRGAFSVELPTDLERVGEAVQEVCAGCFADGAASRRTRFRLCTILAEALGNAMLYGNHGDPSLRVRIEVRFDNEHLVLAISDEGDGFDHTAVPLLLGDDSIEATRGRGLFMIHRLADRVEFNERGNTIWVTLPRR
ncbi:MAG: ATP-binding protein [Gemmatimonadales bacterium]